MEGVGYLMDTCLWLRHAETREGNNRSSEIIAWRCKATDGLGGLTWTDDNQLL